MRLTDKQRDALALLTRTPSRSVLIAPTTLRSLIRRGLAERYEREMSRRPGSYVPGVRLTDAGRAVLPLVAVEDALRNLVDDERGMETASGILIELGRSPRRTDDAHAVRAALEVLEAEGKVKGYSVKRSRFWRSGREPDAPRGVLDPAVPVRDAYWVDYVEPRAVVA